MRFALFCDDASVIPLVDALVARVAGHQLTHVVRATAQSVELLDRLKSVSVSGPSASVRVLDHWEDLLITKEIDAVLVGGSDPLILEGTKQLAAAGLPILFIPQAAQGSTFVYELSLIRDDNHVALYPLLWHRFDAAANHLREALRDNRLGKIQFLQLNRSLSRSSASAPISQAEVDAQLLLDADLLRWLIGDYDQVTGLRTAASTDGVLMQSVVLAGRSLPQANWSINPVDGPDFARLTVRGERGVAELRRDGSSHCWTCELDGTRVAGDERTSATRLLDVVDATIQRNRSTESDSARIVGGEWGELVKCFETVDATHRSVARRRTIELHFEPMSERAIFKTQMTAIGCSLLVVTFLLTLCYLGIASIVPLPSSVLIGFRTLVFAPLVIFLIAQILLPLTRPSSSEKTPLP